MKKITFNKLNEYAGQTDNSPSPATKSIPKWYREMPRHNSPGSPTFDGNGVGDFTVKICPPFLDSMMSGYVMYTEYDMNVSWIDGDPYFEWRTGGNLMSTHAKSQVVPEQIPEGYSDQPLKFNSLWQIKTPPGYSTLFMHPLNRTDLPFHTISGVVETDLYKSTINFPFLIQKSFEGIIPAGTPMVQMFPFKRENWKMQIGEADQKEVSESDMKLNHKLFGGYKTQWWRRKEYR